MTEVMDDDDRTMIERVAQAIWMENRPAGAPSFDELDFLDQGRVKMIARACIKTMREPSEHLLTSEGIHTNCHMCGGHLEGWHKIIDLALQED